MSEIVSFTAENLSLNKPIALATDNLSNVEEMGNQSVKKKKFGLVKKRKKKCDDVVDSDETKSPKTVEEVGESSTTKIEEISEPETKLTTELAVNSEEQSSQSKLPNSPRKPLSSFGKRISTTFANLNLEKSGT
ncbi:unnamed protein product [Dimorphilus gyrociliatus]|uniref:Uncharacterized protein n=1 Tax=Dimorphilus gyrociliatus TaxID=2664684 RepID=A0A7I8VIL7_9ANNE|nr:unnamed protein product [Dimorphilus gyrociliatus]